MKSGAAPPVLSSEGTKGMTTKETRITMKQIQQTVADYFGISIKRMTDHSRKMKYARPRQLAMYLTWKLTGYQQYTMIGKHFGGRDHSTVIHAIKTMQNQMLLNSEIRVSVGILTEKITARATQKNITKPTETKNEPSGMQPGIEAQLAEINKRLGKIEVMMQKWEC